MYLGQILSEMAAKKLCDKCGKSMAANHYWYKGGWKCKGASKAANEVSAASEPTDQPTEQLPLEEPKQHTPNQVEPKAQQDTRHPEVDTPPSDKTPVAAAAEIATQSLQAEGKVIAEVVPLIQAEVDKINKVASKVGAPEVTLEIVGSEYKDYKYKNDLGEVVHAKQKMVHVIVKGTTPRITGADGKTWEFVGVITPSSQGRAILKMTPSAADTPELRRLYNSDPYYCDYCRTTRRRNETFIVSNNGAFRQVGRNCLKDFVGGADPHAILRFFEWFNTHRQFSQFSVNASGGGEGDERGSGGRPQIYFTPEEILRTAVAVIHVEGAYVPSKSEYGSTVSSVRDYKWGTRTGQMEPEERRRMLAIRDYQNSDEAKEEAQKILAWFKSLPKSEIESNTFFQNVSIMVDEDAVESRQIGYIIGLYPSYKRAQGEKATTNTLTKVWNEAWGESMPIENLPATVLTTRAITGMYGTSIVATLTIDDKYQASWKYSGRNDINDGDQFVVTGELVPDAYLNPPRIKFVPSRKWLRSAFKE